jgi:hypothetical protein
MYIIKVNNFGYLKSYRGSKFEFCLKDYQAKKYKTKGGTKRAIASLSTNLHEAEAKEYNPSQNILKKVTVKSYGVSFERPNKFVDPNAKGLFVVSYYEHQKSEKSKAESSYRGIEYNQIKPAMCVLLKEHELISGDTINVIKKFEIPEGTSSFHDL